MPKAITLWPASPDGDTFAIERSLLSQGYAIVAGTDEAGRGPLAGPVVAACVILPPHCEYQQFQDSKKLSAKARGELAQRLVALEAQIGVGIVSAAEIDRLNILQASLLAMKKAVEKLPCLPDFLLVDGKFTVPMAVAQKAYVKGDSRSASISAASIVAKVTRDAIMEQYHLEYPQYNFARHKGYPTAEHRRIIREIGPCSIHRQSFKPVRDCSEK
ncbi:MAG TPA: ribonuclease HII [Desulfurivibrionaceae bacterium]